MGQTYDVQIKINAETGGLVGEAAQAEAAIEKLAKTADNAGKEVKDAGTEAQTAGKKIKGAGAAANDANGKFRKSGNGAKQAAGKYNDLAKAARAVKGAILAYLTIETGRRIISAADDTQLLAARIERLSGSSIEATENLKELKRIASSTGGDLATTVKLWESLTASLEDLGYKQSDIQQVTESLQQLGVIGGASTEDMKNALRQLSQSFASGIVRAEEYNSVMEQMPEVWRRVAAATGKSLGELRQQMLDGELTSTEVMNALLGQAEDINNEFADMPRTVAQASAALGNSLSVAVSKLDSKLGATKHLADFIDFIANGVDYAVKWYESFEDNSEDLDVLVTRMGRLNGEIAAQKKHIDNLTAANETYVGTAYKVGKAAGSMYTSQSGEDPIDRARKKLAALQEQFKKTEEDYLRIGLGVDRAGNRINEDGTPYSKPEDTPKPKPDPVDPKKAAKIAKQKADAANYLAQIHQRNMDELELLGAKNDAELKQIDELEQKRLISADQAGAARVALMTDYANQIAEIRLRELDERGAEDEKLQRVKDQEQKRLDRYRESYASQHLLEQESIQTLKDIEAQGLQDRQAQIDYWRELELITDAEQKLLLEQAEQQHQDNLTAIDQAAAQQRMAVAQSMADSLMSITGSLAGQQSGAYRVMFAISKGFALAQAAMSLGTNIAKASEIGYPQNIPLIAGAMAQGAQILSMIQGAQLGPVGQAHDGIDKVPREGTWLLDKGERVYTQRSAEKLDDMHKKINEGGSSEGGGGAPQFTIVNIVDSKLVQDFLNSLEGEQVLMNVIKGNSSEVKQILGA